VVLGARRTDRLDVLAAALPGPAAVCRTDVTRRADLERLVARAVGEFGRAMCW
jgi:NADP-dependent 3-hydroxy acid dehydrogenase YdfG